MIVVKAITEKKHYEKEVFTHLVTLAFSMNCSTNRCEAQLQQLLDDFKLNNCRETNIALQFDNLTPSMKIQRLLEDEFIVGLIDGDGCFFVSFLANNKIKLGFHITVAFTESQVRLFQLVKDCFGQCGVIQKKHKGPKTYCRFQLDSFSVIQKQIIPFMDKYNLYTEKANHYLKFKEVVYLVQSKAHLDARGFSQIVNIAYDMNLGGKRRKLSKEEYLKKYAVE